MYLNDERTNVTLTNCKDPGLSVDEGWWGDAPPGLLKFESTQLTVGEQLSL
jgi:hypothetical protein